MTNKSGEYPANSPRDLVNDVGIDRHDPRIYDLKFRSGILGPQQGPKLGCKAKRRNRYPLRGGFPKNHNAHAVGRLGR